MHRGKVVAAAVVAAAMLLLLLWGSGSGTTVLHSPSGEAGAPPTRVAPPPPDVAAQTTAAPEEMNELAAPALDWLMIVFALIVLAIAVRFLQWLLNRDWEEAEEPDDEELGDDLDLLLAATSESARTTALAEGEPRNVVVRCWVALEDAAAASGLTRDPAETAAEFTRRFLGTWEVDEASTRELAELYREARFSRHPVSRATGDRAVAVVGSIHEQLRASAHRAEEAAGVTAASPTTEPGGAP
ncbi:DUF4129 domain-containing protein [Ornithinimicrobium cavernae]|uniref:DUF4129 domain-containing protein n=1 Tax=Ornithinimicrobium cavernae TaxID=2666047 RepID=UPI000D699124|nr:DUF4129 domain-containing protein [Ornithinimicrobium cavernae]